MPSRLSRVDAFPLSLNMNHLRHAILLLWLAIGAILSACQMPASSSFDSVTWKAQRGVDATKNQRGSMLEQAKSAVKTGMPRAEVVALLGEPDARHPDAFADIYLLGLGWGPDEYFFEVVYQGDRVAQTRLGQY